MKRVYLAGPMTGIPQFNFPQFDAEAAWLRELGYEVISPAELDDPESREQALASKTGLMGDVTETWGQFLARDVQLIADDGIEAVVVLPGWERSRGARLETFVAHLCGLPIVERTGFVNLRRVHSTKLARAWAGESMWDVVTERLVAV